MNPIKTPNSRALVGERQPWAHRAQGLLLSLTALLAPPFLTAQEADEPVPQEGRQADRTVIEERLDVEDSVAYLPTSNTIANKLPTDPAWTPANVGTVDSVLMSEQNAQTVGDALRNVSGINVQTGSGVFDFFVVRGFDSLTSGLVLVDGAPEPESTFYQLYDAERVEVFKGPAGFLYGSNPLAGVVNIVRRQPVPHRFATVGIEAGSFGTLGASVDLNTASAEGTTSFRLNGLTRESDGYRDGRDTSVTAVHPKFAWRPDDRSSLTVSLEVLQSDYRPDAGLPIVDNALADVPRERSYASPLDESHQDITRVQVDYERQLNDRITLRNKLYSRELDWQTQGTLVSGILPFPGDPLVVRTLLELDDHQNFLGDQFEVLWRTERHSLLAGVELARYSDDYSLDVGFLPVISLLQPVEAPVVEPIPIPGQAARGNTDTTIVAPYVIDQIRLSDRVQVQLGARFDSIDFEDTVSGTQRSDSELSPMAGVTFEATPGTWLYANAARSFAPASVRVVGDRKPEESQQFELGVRRDFANGRLRSIFAVYQLERENIAIPDDNGFTQQAGDQRSRGFEAEFGGQLTDKLSAVFSYAYTDAELTRFTEAVFLPVPPFILTFDHSGNVPAFAPENLFSAWLSRDLPAGLRLSGGVRWIDSHFIAEDNAFSIDGYALVDASLSYSLDRWRVSLDLENLTDQEYETRGFGSFSVIPGQPISANLRIEYRM